MIITRTPFRISFIGGGTDFSEFYTKYSGAVISTTINKYVYISSHKFFDNDQIRVRYSKAETVDNVNKIQHPLYREVLKSFVISGALEISSNADVPAGTGLASSSAFTVGLLHNLYAIKGKFISKYLLANEAYNIERNKLREPVGKQDHFATSFGGLNIIKFNGDESVNVEPFHLSKKVYKKLQENLLTFYIGNIRSASKILHSQEKNIKNDEKMRFILQKMVNLVWDAKELLYKGFLNDFGRLLHENWILKQKLAQGISDNYINELYENGIKKGGAIGGKVLGAGGGGFLLFYCDQKNHRKLRNEMKKCRELKFKFENEGSKVIYMEDEYND